MNKILHNRKAIRLKKFDYSQSGGYFVTICTKDREHLFGEIRKEKMIENEYAAIVRWCWEDVPHHYNHIELDAFVIMSNHVHGIIFILDDEIIVGARSPRLDADETEATEGRLDMEQRATERRPYKKPTLGNIVAYFKYQSAKHINVLRNTQGVSVWQRNYYEHIIRNEKALHRIQEYIVSNPLRWELDRENPESNSKDEFYDWLDTEGTKKPKALISQTIL